MFLIEIDHHLYLFKDTSHSLLLIKMNKHSLIPTKYHYLLFFSHFFYNYYSL